MSDARHPEPEVTPRVEGPEDAPTAASGPSKDLTRAALIAHGLAQGAILDPRVLHGANWWPVADADNAAPFEGAAGAIIISHSCDLASTDLEHQPAVEVLPFTLEGRRPRADFEYAMHPRILEFGSGEQTYRIEARNRRALRRDALLSEEGIVTSALGDQDIALVKEWVTRSYDRLELPEAFTERVVQKKVRSALRKARESLGRLYIALDPWDELPNDQPYDVDLRLLVKSSVDLGDAEVQAEIAKLLHTLMSAFVNAEGVLVRGINSWPIATQTPTHGQTMAASTLFIRRPQDISALELSDFRPLHPSALTD